MAKVTAYIIAYNEADKIEAALASVTWADDLIVVPNAPEYLQPIVMSIPLQLLSYHMSVLRGFDPDFPRNLSKTLTVD